MNDLSKDHSATSSDELDLFKLFQIAWKQKYLVLAVVALFGLAALSYASFAPRVLQVSSVLRPVATNDLDALNRSALYTLHPDEALLMVRGALESYETRLGFFRENQTLFSSLKLPGNTLEQSFEFFNTKFVSTTLQDPRKLDKFNAFVRVTFTYPEGLDGPEILNSFVKYTIGVEYKKIVNEFMATRDNRIIEIETKLSAARANYDAEKKSKIASLYEADELQRARLQDELQALRLQLKTQRYDRMAQLSEAISIANMLGIKKPATKSSFTEPEHSGPGSLIKVDTSAQQLPLYFMGTEALEAERSVLQKRKSDDFTEVRIAQIAKELQMLLVNREVEVLSRRENENLFLRDIEPFRSEMSRLNNLSSDLSPLPLVTIDQLALQPLSPIRPNKPFILLMGLLLGLTVATLLVIIRHFATTNRSSLVAHR